MPKTKQQKQDEIQVLTKGLKSASSVVFANFQGLTVAQSEDLRRKSREQQVTVVAAKKTLLKRALEEAGFDGVVAESFQGGVATFFAMGDEVAAAKVVSNFAKNHEIVSVFGGLLEGRLIDATAVHNLASLPSREQLLAKLVGSINAPVYGFVNALAGNLRNLVGVLNNIKNAKA